MRQFGQPWSFGYQRSGGSAPVSGLPLFQLPADRSTTWQPGVTYNTYAGLTSLAGHGSSGIPVRNTQSGSTITPSGDLTGATDFTNIQNAINACPSGQFVKLSLGVFHTQGLTINKDITLRGSGSGANLSFGINGVPGPSHGAFTVDATATQIIGTAGSGTNIISAGNQTLPATILDQTLLVADATHGSNQIHLASIPSGLAVGDIVILDHTTLAFSATTTVDNPNGSSTITLPSVPAGVTVGLNAYSNDGTNYIFPEGTVVNSFTGTTVTLSKPTIRDMPIGSYAWFDTDPEAVWGLNFVPGPFPSNPEWGWFVCNPYCARVALIEVAAIDAVNKIITSVMPIRGDYRVALSAKISRVSASTPFVYGVGIEDMMLFDGEHGNINFGGCAYSWIKNVDSGWGRGADGITTCYRCEIRDSVLHESPDVNPGGGGYKTGFAAGATDCLIENNVVWFGNKVMVMQGAGPGNVIAYNCMDDAFGTQYPSGPEAGLNAAHYVGSHFALFEGNYCFMYKGDTFWGNSFKIVLLRNWLSGLRAAGGPLKTLTATPGIGPLNAQPYRDLDYSGRSAVDLQAYLLTHSFVGNVLGYSGQVPISWHDAGGTWTGGPFHYEDWTGASGGSDTVMWRGGNNQQGGVNIQHTNTYLTLLRQGNWDWFTGSQIFYANIGDTGTTSTGPPLALPNSLYLPGGNPPAFWGANPWPWLDPSTGTVHTLLAKARLAALLAATPTNPISGPIPPGNNVGN